MSEHTPTPWYLVDNDMYLEIVVPWEGEPDVVNQYCPSVVSVIGYGDNDGIDGRVNAEFIVRACNSHDQLVAALKLAREKLALADESAFDVRTLPIIDEALAAAGE